MHQTTNEERWNALSHAFGVGLGIAGMIVLLVWDAQRTSISLFSILVYSISLILLYTSSTLYHAVKQGKWKRLWRKMDHISIFLLIAGTYTPVSLLLLDHVSGKTIFYVVWGIALLGIVKKIFFTGRWELLSLFLYLLMGWLIVFDFRSLLLETSSLGFTLLILGGVFYTVGTLFYAIRKIPYNHVIWHFFVLAGSISHYFFILVDVV